MDVSPRNHLCLICLGFLVLFPSFYYLTATQDILAGTTIHTSSVLVAEAIPGILTSLFGNWIISRLSLVTSLGIGIVSYVASILMLVLGNAAYVRLVAVGFVNFSMCWMNVWCMGLTAHLRDDGRLISGLETGKNLSGSISGLIYTALTLWLCLSPRLAMSTSIASPILIVLTYAALDKTAIKQNIERSGYTKLSASGQGIDECPELASGQDKAGQDRLSAINSDDNAGEEGTEESLLTICWKIFPQFIYCFWAAISVWLSSHAILTTIVYPTSNIAPRDTFQFYSLAMNISRCIGGILYSAYSHMYPDRVRAFRHIWLLSALCLAHMVFAVFASWYRFLPGLSVTIMFCASFGFTEGWLWVFVFMGIKDMFGNVRDAGYGLSIAQSGRQVAYLIAGMLGVRLEAVLLRHCRDELFLGEYCLSRSNAVRGWEEYYC
ncbi:uncharacterized protein LOC116615642 [Nematostella vectensis]|uniref:uncharacterized protein LOC116615642 n=1 Tax=Nematostella vectensis TaxID=45351 RepID=UPI00207717F9|nr:uncharacterized protein LOC116615642 [Nematostella vectensis]